MSYRLVEPCDTEGASFASTEEAFIAGSEWESFRVRLEAEPGIWYAHIHQCNAMRLLAMAERHGRRVTTYRHDDTFEHFTVHPKGDMLS